MDKKKKIDLKNMMKEQIRLSGKVELRDGFSRMGLIAGADFAYHDGKVAAAIVVCKIDGFNIVDRSVGSADAPVPFRKGFLAYRVMPAIIRAYEGLRTDFDILLVNGRGIDHPRKLGLASHLGLVIDKPTVGVSKSTSGKIDSGKIYLNRSIAGFEVRTRDFSNPLYISPGHKISLGSALESIKISIKYPHKLPEPLNMAHKMVKRYVSDLSG